MKFYFVAGERSGDLHGGNLIRALRSKQNNLACRGFGGNTMKEAGMELTVHYRELAFMGFVEVLANLATISQKIKQCKGDILQYNPDVVVLIDYAGFNMRIARFAKQNGFKVFWYISPKVWAWNQSRALKLKACIDRMFVILPFEKEFFSRYDWEVDYVGNPVLDASKQYKPDENFLSNYQFQTDKPIVAFLPGSRRQEVEKIIPIMEQVTTMFPEVQFGVAVVDNLPHEVYKSIKQQSNVKLVSNATYDLLTHSKAAVVTSGTATLETALFKIPQVVVYKANYLSYLIGKQVIRVLFISLVNLIAQKKVVTELIQHEASDDRIVQELKRLLDDLDYRNEMIHSYNDLINLLDVGSASENTARLMLEYMKS